MALETLFRKAFWGLAACGLVYALVMGALTVPAVQRNVSYVNNINPTYWEDLNNTEQYGFIHHQIQPFTITTPDNVTLFVWHILPTHLYSQHEKALKEQPEFGVQPFEFAYKTVGLQLLFNDPRASVVVTFHGNAAHLASNVRPSAYQQALGVSTPEKPVHVIAFDYRGFGLSTGSPTEMGVIQDGISILSALTGHSDKDEKSGQPVSKYLDPSQIILVGQSMGTFISTAVYHDWVMRLQRTPFKALALIASFSSLPNLLASYSFKGLTPPLFSPLMGYPKLQQWLLSTLEEKWDASSRLVEIASTPALRLNLVMIHARNDVEIPWREGRANWDNVLKAASGGKIDIERSYDNEEFTSEDGSKRLRWERVRHGGHNRIQTSEQARLGLLRLIEGE